MINYDEIIDELNGRLDYKFAKALAFLIEENEDLKQIMVAAIKAGDWKVDGACDPDKYIGDRL